MNKTRATWRIIHTYPVGRPRPPSPTAPPPDLAPAAMEHLCLYGNTRRLTEEELANAVHIDSRRSAASVRVWATQPRCPWRKRKILATTARSGLREQAVQGSRGEAAQPPKKPADRFHKAAGRALHDLKISSRRAFLRYPSEKLGEKYSR